MRGYPKHVATTQDFLNLLSMDDYRSQATQDLIAIFQMDDEEATQVVSGSEQTEDLLTKQIENPLPLWKHTGFKSRREIALLITKSGGHI